MNLDSDYNHYPKSLACLTFLMRERDPKVVSASISPIVQRLWLI